MCLLIMAIAGGAFAFFATLHMHGAGAGVTWTASSPPPPSASPPAAASTATLPPSPPAAPPPPSGLVTALTVTIAANVASAIALCCCALVIIQLIVRRRAAAASLRMRPHIRWDGDETSSRWSDLEMASANQGGLRAGPAGPAAMDPSRFAPKLPEEAGGDGGDDGAATIEAGRRRQQKTKGRKSKDRSQQQQEQQKQKKKKKVKGRVGFAGVKGAGTAVDDDDDDEEEDEEAGEDMGSEETDAEMVAARLGKGIEGAPPTTESRSTSPIPDEVLRVFQWFQTGPMPLAIEKRNLRGAHLALGIDVPPATLEECLGRYPSAREHGRVELAEFRTLIEQLAPLDEVLTIFRRVDADNSGDVDVGELHLGMHLLGL